MQIKNISDKKLVSLGKLYLPKDILNTESELFIFESKNKWDKNHKIFKKLYIDEGETFSNKLYTINEEIDKKEEIGMEELILPDKLVSIKGKIAGFTMPYIDSINLKTALNSSEFSLKEKLVFLKEIGEILEKIKSIRSYTSINNFYINDLHANNFIVNKQTKKVNVVDLDSARIGNNLSSPSKYLKYASPIYDFNKYVKKPNNVGGTYEADENTDLYCYIMVILEFLYGKGIEDLSIGEYYMYLEYLFSLGISKEFIDKISYIYTEHNNENPYESLESLEEFYGRTSKYAFEAEKTRKRIFTK